MIDGLIQATSSFFAPTRRAPSRPLHHAGLTAKVNGNGDRKSTRLNSSHLVISYAVFCLKKKKTQLRICPSSPITPFPHLHSYQSPRAQYLTHSTRAPVIDSCKVLIYRH